MQLTDAEYVEASDILTKRGLIGSDQLTSFGHAIEVAGDVTYREWVQQIASLTSTEAIAEYGHDSFRAVVMLGQESREPYEPIGYDSHGAPIHRWQVGL